MRTVFSGGFEWLANLPLCPEIGQQYRLIDISESRFFFYGHFPRNVPEFCMREIEILLRAVRSLYLARKRVDNAGRAYDMTASGFMK